MLRQFLLGFVDESVLSALCQLHQQLIIICAFCFPVMVQQGCEWHLQQQNDAAKVIKRDKTAMEKWQVPEVFSIY